MAGEQSLWACIAAYVTFATPYAIFVFQQYSVSIPIEIDESARIDGASPWQIYLRLYLPWRSAVDARRFVDLDRDRHGEYCWNTKIA